MITRTIVKKGTYHDSIALMKISNDATRLAKVSQAAVVMATPVNKRLLNDLGLHTDEINDAGPDDLVIALQTEDEDSMNNATLAVERSIYSNEAIGGEEIQPRTIDSALQEMPDANLVTISIAGKFAKREALKALANGLNVFMFSAGVPIDDELQLKEIAKARNLLMMGPDCGTAVINNVVLGFGNALSRGKIGIISASGTGLQQVSTLIHGNGLGISQAIGTGGNDLSARIGGIMMIEGMKLLEKDKNTEVIVLISKPPDSQTRDRVLVAAGGMSKPVVLNFLGEDPGIQRKGFFVATTLEDTAEIASAVATRNRPKEKLFSENGNDLMDLASSESANLSGTQKYVRGLFSGGTLCSEALVILTPLLGKVFSNVPLDSRWQIENVDSSKEHTCIDMGSEDFTIGRPHPMIDFTLRKRRITREALDPETAVVLLDVVLGYGANNDPSAELIPSIQEGKSVANDNGRSLPVVGSIIGTDLDPQDLHRQEMKLREAGMVLMPSNAQAARIAALIASRGELASTLLKR